MAIEDTLHKHKPHTPTEEMDSKDHFFIQLVLLVQNKQYSNQKDAIREAARRAGLSESSMM